MEVTYPQSEISNPLREYCCWYVVHPSNCISFGKKGKLQCRTQVPKATGDLIEMSRDTFFVWRLVHMKGFASDLLRSPSFFMLQSCCIHALHALSWAPRPSAASVAGAFGENRDLRLLRPRILWIQVLSRYSCGSCGTAGVLRRVLLEV